MSAHDDPENSLLARIARGDAGAVRECIARCGGLVWSLARRFSLTSQDAEDAVQEIFLEIWKHAGRHDPEKGSEKVFVAVTLERPGGVVVSDRERLLLAAKVE